MPKKNIIDNTVFSLQADEWFKEGNKLLVTVARKSTTVRKPEEAEELLEEVYSFLKPGEENQNERIRKITDVAHQLYGKDESMHAPVISENKEMLESFISVIDELKTLASNLRLAEEEKERLQREQEEARMAEEARKGEEARLELERKRAEEARLAEEIRLIEEKRISEEARIAEEARLAQEKINAEEERLAEERRKVEEAKLAEEARLAEERRKSEEAKLAEEARLAGERQKLEEEKKRLETERAADEARRAEEIRKAEELRTTEEKRLQQERILIEEHRISEEKRIIEEIRIREELRIAEERKKAEEVQQFEEAKLAEEKKKLQEERKALEEEKRVEEARRTEEMKKVTEAERVKLLEESRKLEEAKKTEEERLAQEAKKAEELKESEETKKNEEAKLIDEANTEEVDQVEDMPKKHSLEITEITETHKIEIQTSAKRIPSPIPIIEDATEAPVFTTPLSDAVIQEGSKFSFMCHITGHPKPSINWYKAGISIQNNPDYHTSYDNGLCTLTIEETFAEDSARYTCRATNSAGEDETTALLSVKETEPEEVLTAPSFTKTLQPGIAKEGSTFQFECKVEGNPLPTVQWFKNGECIDNSPDYIITYNNGVAVLKFEKVYLEDKADYTCKASNQMGSAQSTANLVVTRKLLIFFQFIRKYNIIYAIYFY